MTEHNESDPTEPVSERKRRCHCGNHGGNQGRAMGDCREGGTPDPFAATQFALSDRPLQARGPCRDVGDVQIRDNAGSRIAPTASYHAVGVISLAAVSGALHPRRGRTLHRPPAGNKQGRWLLGRIDGGGCGLRIMRSTAMEFAETARPG
jgi:hypothetical protein